MNALKLSEILTAEIALRGWSMPELARNAGVSDETARRACHGVGVASLENSNKLLVAIGKQLTVTTLEPVEVHA